MDYEATEVRKESPTEREMSQLQRSTQELMIQFESLEVRLSSVLAPQPKLANAGTPQEALTPLPQQIRSQREIIDSANYTLRSILSRLEL